MRSLTGYLTHPVLFHAPPTLPAPLHSLALAPGFAPVDVHDRPKGMASLVRGLGGAELEELVEACKAAGWGVGSGWEVCVRSSGLDLQP